MSAISFESGISGVSRVHDTTVDKDYPTSKAAFKPSGDSVPAHIWKVLDMDRTFEKRELRFAINPAKQNTSITPDEQYLMTDKALSVLNNHINDGPEIKKALEVFQESKELQEYLIMSRNVLLAG